LLDSVPKLVTDAAELVTFRPIRGELPSPLSPPPGCHFHLRCPFAQDRCRRDAPMLVDGDAGRRVACHFPLEGGS
jgi:peptide/nickel transport system ATP-binding protein